MPPLVRQIPVRMTLIFFRNTRCSALSSLQLSCRSPLTLDDGANIGRYGTLEDLVLSGILWEEARPQLANKAFLMRGGYGSGQIISFAEDSNYRAYAEATQLLFMNASLLGSGR